MVSFALGVAAVLLCTVVQCAFIAGLKVSLLGRTEIARSGSNFSKVTILLSIVTAVLFVGMMVQVFLWALILFSTGEIDTFQTAYYFSMVNFTSLGYGDITLSGARAILGPMEAANGILMLGLSTSVLFWVLVQLRVPSN